MFVPQPPQKNTERSYTMYRPTAKVAENHSFIPLSAILMSKVDPSADKVNNLFYYILQSNFASFKPAPIKNIWPAYVSCKLANNHRRSKSFRDFTGVTLPANLRR